MAQAVRSGAVSARELLAASLARIAATDSQVNAFTLQTRVRAEAEADAIDAQRARAPQALGPLAGVPFAVKNLYDIEGEVTVAGSTVNRSHAPAEADAVLVAHRDHAEQY